MKQLRSAKAFNAANPGPGKAFQPYRYRGNEPHTPKNLPQAPPQDDVEETP